ncbi:MAG: crosslink repair DNA glycosylase YcaQ family protein [Dehalococcoidia bacterium]
MAVTDLSLAQARRIALAAQGFADARPTGRVDVRHLRRVIGRIGMLQIDSVNVVVRAHYMPLFSRLGPYRMTLLDEMAYKRRELFEYWGHAASFIPTERYSLFRHRMEAVEPRYRIKSLMRDDPSYVDAVLDEVRANGPLNVATMDDPGERTGPWWGYGKGKTALEWHFARGDVAVLDRKNFARLYDLPERVFDASVLEAPAPAAEEARRQLLLLAARHHGIGTQQDLGHYYMVKRAGPLLRELVDAGDLREVSVEGWTQPAYLHPEAKLPRRVDARALLTPFDPLIWTRERVQRLFGFHYRIEIYVPQPQRRFGYYVMPFLLGDELVGRVDLKSDRKRGVLLVQSAFIEHGREPGEVAAALASELATMASWLGLAGVRVGRRGDLAGELRRAVGERGDALAAGPR